MDFIQLVTKRSSVRKFERRQVEQEKLLAVLEAGRLAPTACNYQPYKVLVLQTSDGLAKLREGNPYMYESPLALIICVNHETVWKRLSDGKDYADIDGTIVTDHMMLAATELGLGSVWMGAFDPDHLRGAFHIPEGYEPVNVLLIGYPATDMSSSWSMSQDGKKRRKPLAETIVYETF